MEKVATVNGLTELSCDALARGIKITSACADARTFLWAGMPPGGWPAKYV